MHIPDHLKEKLNTKGAISTGYSSLKGHTWGSLESNITQQFNKFWLMSVFGSGIEDANIGQVLESTMLALGVLCLPFHYCPLHTT